VSPLTPSLRASPHPARRPPRTKLPIKAQRVVRRATARPPCLSPLFSPFFLLLLPPPLPFEAHVVESIFSSRTTDPTSRMTDLWRGYTDPQVAGWSVARGDRSSWPRHISLAAQRWCGWWHPKPDPLVFAARSGGAHGGWVLRSFSWESTSSFVCFSIDVVCLRSTEDHWADVQMGAGDLVRRGWCGIDSTWIGTLVD
jgi:hypothetical protein